MLPPPATRFLRHLPLFLCLCVVASLAAPSTRGDEPADVPTGVQQSDAGITHSFLATGNETFIMGADGEVIWRYPGATRDGWVLESGNVLLAVNKDGKDFPGGGVVEVTREGKVVCRFKGTQSAVNTVQPLGNGKVLLTEAGPTPRLLEVGRNGKVLVDVPLRCQTRDLHLQSRMARKLP